MQQSGALALVGSGEFLDVMNETDNFLLQSLGGSAAAQVVVIPTASGLEPGQPERWATMGLQHFRRLGASVETAMIINRQDTTDPQILALLEQANFYYFSGGNPLYLTETLRDSPVWEIISRRHSQGAVLAGCSAGAMAFSAYTINIGAMRGGNSGPMWLPALNLVPGLAALPHFDRMRNFAGPDQLEKLLEASLHLEGQPLKTVVGVDEDTALVRTSAASQEWQVWGRQTVSVYRTANHREAAQVYRPGDTVTLA